MNPSSVDRQPNLVREVERPRHEAGEGHLRNVTICDNNPLELNAIVGKGVIWLIALLSLLLSARALGRDARDGRV